MKEIENEKDQKVLHHTVHHQKAAAVAPVTRRRTKKVSESVGPAAEAMRKEEKRDHAVRRGKEIEIRTGNGVQGVATDQVLQGQDQKVEVLIKSKGSLKPGGMQLFACIVMGTKKMVFKGFSLCRYLVWPWVLRKIYLFWFCVSFGFKSY